MHHRDTPNDIVKLDAFLPDGFCVLAMRAADKAALESATAAFPQLACSVVALGDEFSESDGVLSAMSAQHNIAAFLLRPDRQIYAALKRDAAPPNIGLERHLKNLAQQIYNLTYQA